MQRAFLVFFFLEEREDWAKCGEVVGFPFFIYLVILAVGFTHRARLYACHLGLASGRRHSLNS